MSVSTTDPVLTSPGQVASATQYGATVPGVQSYIPHRVITETSTPSTVQVQQFLANVASQVSLTIGDLDRLTGTFLADVISNAQMCVLLGAAAWTEDSAFPEQTDRQDSSSWGAVLWARFNMLLQQLAVTVSRGPATPDEGPFYPDLGCAWSQPVDPLIVDVGGALVEDFSDPYGYPDGNVDAVQTEINDTSGFDTNYSQGAQADGGNVDEYDEVG
jgi:hypothetical protein